MNCNKKSIPPRGVPQPFNKRTGSVPQSKPGAAQLKTGVSAQNIKRPVAPPVYRPQPVPKVLQTKSSSSQSPRLDLAQRQPMAPPVYRPAAGKIAQPKVIAPQRKPPTPPPVYRPEQKRIAQPKLASAHTPAKHIPAYRPQPRSTVQAKEVAARSSLQATHRPGASSPPRTTPPHARQTRLPTHDVAQPTWGWGAVGALAFGAAATFMTGGVGLVAAGAAAAGGYLAHRVSDWYALRPGEEFAPDGYGFDDLDPVEPLLSTDSELAAVNVDLQPGQGGMPFRSGSYFDPEPIRDTLYLARQVHVRSVRVGRGRLDTGRPGKKQGAHTFAWTAFALSLERLAGMTLAEATTELFVMAESVASHSHQNPKCLDKIRSIRLDYAPNFGTARMGIDQWQRFFSGLLQTYIEAYQLSKEATHIKTGIHGSGSPRREDLYRDRLIKAEYNLRTTGHAGASAAEVADWASRLLDVSFAPSLGKEGYARAVYGWLTGMNRSFPNLMAAMGTTIEAEVMDVVLAPTWQEPGVTTVRHLFRKYAWS